MTNIANKQNVIEGKRYRFTLITEKLIRMEYSESGVFEDNPTQVVMNRDFGNVQFELIEADNRLEIITNAVHIYYVKDEKFSSSSLFADLRYNYSAFNNRWYYGETPKTLKGTARTLDETDGAVELEEGIIGKNGFAILDDSKSFLIDENHNPIAREHEELDIYFVAYGRDYKLALKDFYRLTGETPLLPRYALGNWWSRYWKYTEESYMSLIKKFQEQEVPLSVSVIDMDWHLTDVPARFGSAWTGYTWNKELFPNPKRFLTWLHDQGLVVTLNVHPADGIRAFEEQYPIVAEKLKLNTELEEPANFDIMDEDFRKVYFENVHHQLETDGVDFWWIDWQQGKESGIDGIDPLWALNHFHYRDIQNSTENGIILSRYAGPGSHRYPIGFSGDSIITWESLDFQPYFTSTASNIGYSWWSHDIGGHMRGYKDEELTLRWVQFGVFSPINRLHSSASAFTNKEPWALNDIVNQSMCDYLRLRHAMLPYLYTMNVLTHEDGLPLVLPMYYNHPMAEEAYDARNQYYFGTEMMAAPITSKTDPVLKSGCVKVYFPEGNWYDIFTNFRYKGNSVLQVYRDQTEMPVFAKEGAIIPLDANPVKTKATELPEIIEWLVYPGKSNEFILIEDFSGKRVKTSFTLDIQLNKIEIETFGDLDILPKERKHRIKLNATNAVTIKAVNVGEIEIDHFDCEDKSQTFEVIGLEQFNIMIDIEGFAPIEQQDIKQSLFSRLDKAEIEYQIKDDIWSAYQNGLTELQFISIITDLENDRLRKSLYELLYIKMS